MPPHVPNIREAGLARTAGAEHTPGPWEVDRTTEDCYVICQPRAVRSARNSITKVLHQSHMRLRRQTEANARLIAAAPDLLAALKDALRLIDLQGQPHITEIMQRAVAKAEGRQP